MTGNTTGFGARAPISTSHSMYCWGSNGDGQLGNNSNGQVGNGGIEDEVTPQKITQVN